jgi:hypothetical protein
VFKVGVFKIKKKIYNKYLTITMVIFFILLSLIGSASNTIINNQNSNRIFNEETEYWALLVAVGEYADDPQQNRPSMLEEVDDLYDLLLQSDIWSEDHIKVIKAEDATVSNILSGLRWLDKMEDKDDISLVYLTTHGFPLGFDIPPFDEEDGTDEALVSYWGFAYKSSYLWDDEINFMLNQLESKGVCLIVDSCYAGGFNDPPDWINNNLFNFKISNNQSSIKKWIEGFGKELSGQNRVILMASCEDEVSYSGGFAPYLIDGIRGYGDSNLDGIVTAEEAFYYAEPRAPRQNPTIFDGYPGELPLFYIDNQKNIDNNITIYDENKDNTITTYNSYIDANSVIKGFVKDAESNNQIQGATLNIRGRDDEGDFFENDTKTDINGFYSFNVPPGSCHITVSAEGYCNNESRFLQISENDEFWINFSMHPHPTENSLVRGYITDNETENGISGANITIYWVGDENQYYTNETISDYSGYYQINIADGEIDLEAEAKNYFPKEIRNIFVPDGKTLWVNLSLVPSPPENSIICGYIKDKDTEEPIPYTRIEFEWIDSKLDYSYQNETTSDSSGFYSINISPGEIYHNIRSHEYEYYSPYRMDAKAYNTQWMNISLEKQKIEIRIAKPLRALYLFNNRIFPYKQAKIIGDIDIEAYAYEDWYWPGGNGAVEKMEFYIDGELKKTLYDEPFIWSWNNRTSGQHTIKVVAYDNNGYSDSKEIQVNKSL